MKFEVIDRLLFEYRKLNSYTNYIELMVKINEKQNLQFVLGMN